MSAPSTQSTLTAFPAVSHRDARILVLGSMPGAASLDAQEYYAHPQNAFWFIMASLFADGNVASTYTDKLKLLKNARVALWDVLLECKRDGSLDSKIDRSSVVCNDFKQFFQQHQLLDVVAFNGKTAEQLFRRHVLPTLPVNQRYRIVSLPSSSPAMATLSRPQKASVWREQLELK